VTGPFIATNAEVWPNPASGDAMLATGHPVSSSCFQSASIEAAGRDMLHQVSGGDQLVLVIGGSSGTGRAVTHLLNGRGVPVRVVSRNPARAALRLPQGLDIRGADMTKAETLPAALDGAGHIILTAGLYSGHPASTARARATEYDGVLNVLAAAGTVRFTGRFLYMTASGVRSRALAAVVLNMWKGHTLEWRWRAEKAIRASDLDYSIIRVGALFDRPAGWRAIKVTQAEQPLSISTRLARTDVAAAFVAALHHRSASRATFEVVGVPGSDHPDWDGMLSRLRPDDRAGPTAGHAVPTPPR
jgi:uncharacterized protein YbjT (DUF2867 family)